MTTWYTSDWHLGHANIIRHSNRPFADVEEMNAELVRRYKAAGIQPDDRVWVLGDVAWKPKYLELFKDLPGQKILIRGNHDKGTKTQFKNAGFVDEFTEAEFEHRGVKFRLSHYPYAGYSTDVRYEDRRPKRFEGEVLIHGHSHVPAERRVNVGFRSINIGVDAWDYGPVHEDQLWECVQEIVK